MLTNLSNRAVCALIPIAILTGCNVTTRPDGTVPPPASTRPDAR